MRAVLIGRNLGGGNSPQSLHHHLFCCSKQRKRGGIITASPFGAQSIVRISRPAPVHLTGGIFVIDQAQGHGLSACPLVARTRRFPLFGAAYWLASLNKPFDQGTPHLFIFLVTDYALVMELFQPLQLVKRFFQVHPGILDPDKGGIVDEQV